YSRNVNPMDAAAARTEVHLPPGPPEGARRRASEAEKAEKAMIGQILPPYVVAVDTTDDPPDAFLFPEEEAVISRAVDKRRREFTTGRFCARRALELLGEPPVAIPTGARGEPLWPPHVIGSIAHCDGYRGAAVAAESAAAAIGIDAEPNGRLPDGVLSTISLPEERDLLRRLADRDPGVRWDRMLFCAKEAVYKAWFPLAGRWLGFEDAVISLRPDGTFSARLKVTGPTVNGRRLTGFSGRWL